MHLPAVSAAGLAENFHPARAASNTHPDRHPAQGPGYEGIAINDSSRSRRGGWPGPARA